MGRKSKTELYLEKIEFSDLSSLLEFDEVVIITRANSKNPPNTLYGGYIDSTDYWLYLRKCIELPFEMDITRPRPVIDFYRDLRDLERTFEINCSEKKTYGIHSKVEIYAIKGCQSKQFRPLIL